MKEKPVVVVGGRVCQWTLPRTGWLYRSQEGLTGLIRFSNVSWRGEGGVQAIAGCFVSLSRRQAYCHSLLLVNLEILGIYTLLLLAFRRLYVLPSIWDA